MNNWDCKTCDHKQIDHRKAKYREQGIIPVSLRNKVLCWGTLRDGTYCNCLEFKYKNLDYLEMKYEEKSY